MIDDKTSFSAVSLALVWIYPTLHLHTCLPPVLHPLSARTEVPHRRRRRLNPSLLPIPLEKVFEKFLDIKNFPWKVQKGREKGFFLKVFFLSRTVNYSYEWLFSLIYTLKKNKKLKRRYL